MGYRTRLIALVLGLAILLGFAALQFYYSDKTRTSKQPTLPVIKETVGRGDVLRSVKTSGVVESNKDILLRSPERCIVKDVLVNAGSQVKKGDLLIELEEKGIRQELERMNKQLEVKRNTLEKYQLNQENTKLSLKQSEEVKQTRLDALKKSLMQQEQALKVGGIDASRVDRTRNEIDLAENDLQNIKEKNLIRLQQMETDEKGLLLQISAQEEELAGKRSMLQDLRITAPESGVVLELPVQQGERVDSEQLLVRMSDFTSYKVVGWGNVSLNGLFVTGDSVIVQLDGKELPGKVGEISQMYEDQMIHFDVHLDNDRNPLLAEKQSVAVEVISSLRRNVIRIKKQAGFENTTQQEVYLVNGVEGMKTEIILGTIGNEWCEVVSGLNEGDVIIPSPAKSENDPDSIAVK